ncbi:MAG: hypothetical protein WBP60_14005 [Gammaproteobacteria bacterium]
MIEPVAVNDIMAAAIAGALIILFGAAYALLFAVSRLRGQGRLMIVAYLAYGLLAFCVLVLARTLNLEGLWQSVTAVMLVGYLVAPRLIWNLCVGTHPPHAAADKVPPATPDSNPTL